MPFRRDSYLPADRACTRRTEPTRQGQRPVILDISNISADADGSLHLDGVTEVPLTDEVREGNLQDYAGVVFDISAGCDVHETSPWQFADSIPQPVLRRIVQVIFFGDDEQTDILAKKLREPYYGSENFLKEFKEIDLKEEKEQEERMRQQKEGQPKAKRFSAFETIILTLPALLVVGYIFFMGISSCKRRLDRTIDWFQSSVQPDKGIEQRYDVPELSPYYSLSEPDSI